MIVYTIIQILLTLAGAGVIGYSIYLMIQVSGDKLLTLDSELGYRYATSYHRWQLYAGIAMVSLIILWIAYILIIHAYRVKHREERLAKKAEKKNAQGYAPNGYEANSQNYYANSYDLNAQGYYPNGYNFDDQEVKQEWNGKE